MTHKVVPLLEEDCGREDGDPDDQLEHEVDGDAGVDALQDVVGLLEVN